MIHDSLIYRRHLGEPLMAYNYTTTLRARPSPVGLHISGFIRPQIAPQSCDGYPAQITAEKGKPYICRDLIAFTSIHCQCATTKARRLYYAYRRDWREIRYGWKNRVEILIPFPATINTETPQGWKVEGFWRIFFFFFEPQLIDLNPFFLRSNIKYHIVRGNKRLWEENKQGFVINTAEKAHEHHNIMKWEVF